MSRNTYTVHTHSFSFAQCGAERNVMLKGKKKITVSCLVFLWEKNNKLLPLRCCCVAPRWDFGTLSQLINHGGPEKLFEKCEFKGITLRQTFALSTLHFALETHIHTHTH